MSLNRPLDHKEYIKLKYLSEPAEEVKQKKLRKKVKVKAATKLSNIRVIDDDLDLQKIKPNDDEDELELQYGTNEEKPFVAMVIDERSAELKRRDIDRNTWKPIVAPSEPEASTRTSSSSTSKTPSDRPKVPSSLPDLKLVKQDPDLAKDKDLSPPRPGRRQKPDDDDLSPPRVSSHRDDGDISPPRRRRSSPSPAHSPPRRSSKPSRWSREPKSRFDHDSSPPRARRRLDSPDDSSPIRPRRRDPSPSSKNSPSNDHREQTRRRDDQYRSRNSPRERNRLGLTEEEMGRGAKTVYRDRGTGQKRDMEAEARTKVKPDPEEEELKKKYEIWSKGLKQVNSLEERTNEVLKEMDKPLARFADDEDRDKFLRERELEDDPMLKYIRKKKVKEETKKAESEGRVYMVKPQYQGPAPAPNRFAIPPGYRWDGVDRSNGFEKKLLSKNNEKIADQEEAYKWSTEDM